MFFNNKYKKEIYRLKKENETLKEDKDYWENIYNKKHEEIEELRKKLEDKEYQLTELAKIKEENEIMKKYYKVDEDLSPEIQAKIIIDLRLHDMEYQRLQEKLTDIKLQLQRSSAYEATCTRYPSIYYQYPYYG